MRLYDRVKLLRNERRYLRLNLHFSLFFNVSRCSSARVCTSTFLCTCACLRRCVHKCVCDCADVHTCLNAEHSIEQQLEIVLFYRGKY